MKYFKRPHLLRRFGEPTIIKGYTSIAYTDSVVMMDIQTTDKSATTDETGTRSLQRLKVFCDTEILVENPEAEQKGDRVWYQGKWFDCVSARLSDNTPLRHWTCTFVECNKQDGPPENFTVNGHYNYEKGEWEE